MIHDGNLSDYWRVDKSSDKAAELASVMDGATNAISLLGGKRRAVWSGAASTSSRKQIIFLDAGVIDNLHCPLSGKAVDVVIGMAIHEVGHEKWTKDIWATHSDWIYELSDDARKESREIHNILEDAYIDSKVGSVSSTLSEYIRTMRNALWPSNGEEIMERVAEIANKEGITRKAIVDLWVPIALFGRQMPPNTSKEMAAILAELLQRTLNYIRTDEQITRNKQLIEIWDWLSSKFPKGDTSSAYESPAGVQNGSKGQSVQGKHGRQDSEDSNQPNVGGGGGEPMDADGDGDGDGEENADGDEDADGEDGESDEDEDADGEDGESDEDEDADGEDGESDEDAEEIIRRNLQQRYGGLESGHLGSLPTTMDERYGKGSISRSEANTLEDYQSSVEDFTRELSGLGIRSSATQIKDAGSTPQEVNHLRRETVRETSAISHIFSQLDIVDSRWRHGLKNGKLDGGRLSKVGTGKDTVFKHREIRGKPSLAVVLLMDVSGSMQHDFDTVSRVSCIFTEALKPLYPKVWHEVITYTGLGYHGVQLTRIASSRMKLSLRSIWKDGGTPSGEAIIVATLLLQRRPERRKMIIHFTDGAPDSNRPVMQALELCQKSNVDVITISVGRRDEALYGKGKCERIETVPELPTIVSKLLKRIY